LLFKKYFFITILIFNFILLSKVILDWVLSINLTFATLQSFQIFTTLLISNILCTADPIHFYEFSRKIFIISIIILGNHSYCSSIFINLRYILFYYLRYIFCEVNCLAFVPNGRISSVKSTFC
jgi:hypothetical protein